MKTHSIFICLLACLACTSVCGQGAPKKALGTLRSIRAAETAVKLNLPRPAGIALPAARVAEKSAQFGKQYQNAAAALQTAQAKVSAPVELTANAKPRVVLGAGNTAVGPIAKRKMDVTVKQRQVDEVLYNWGEMLARNQTSAAAPQLALEGDNVVLTLSRKEAVIHPDRSTAQTVITPVEIGANASALKAATDPYQPNILTAIFKETPEYAAQFTYLHENFIRSLDEFEAASDALHTLLPSRGSLKNLRPGQTAQNQTIRQNHLYSAANLAVDAMNLLQFMDLHRDVFAPSLQSYTEVMHLHNSRGTHIPATFQTFWKAQISI